ncbi:MAG TPA: hypothetical protein VGM89_10485 [Puia sp.]
MFVPSLKSAAPAILACAILVSCSPKLAPEGHYQSSPVMVNGSPADWTLPLRFSNAGFTMQYNITNDDQNLYICVSSGSGPTQLRILRSGMTIYFDPKGEKNKDIGIHFPIQKRTDPRSEPHARGNGSGGYNAGPQLQELLLQSDYYNTTGLHDMENGQFALNDSHSPVHVAIKLNNEDSLLVYEAVVPLKNILGADWASKAAKKNLSVGVFIDATPGMSGGSGGARPGMGMRGMGMGMRGMGGGGRRYGGGQSQGQKEDANWYVFRLASK